MKNNNKIWIILNKKYFSPKINKYIKNNAELKYKNLNKHDYDVELFLFEKNL